jgi:eukaryotic-like serine/threonine-protein kinase
MDRLVDVFSLVGHLLDGQYRVDGVIGEGGYGVVYKGWHIAFEQPIAIKALKMPEVTNAEARMDMHNRFRDEAKLLYKLSQASLSIVRCINFGALVAPTMAWVPYLVLEWLQGRPLSVDLEERRQRGARGRSLDEALQFLAPVANALVYAHTQRVAHRDVKPANVFLTADAGPKLLDFGIAKVMEAGATAENAQRTEGGAGAFTPYYAAPEQLDPRLGATGPWTDVYGFALVLVEMLANKPPMDGSDLVSVVAQATDPARRPTPRSLGVRAPDAVEAVFQRALAVSPRTRFPDMASFWDALTSANRLGLSGKVASPVWTSPSATVPLAAVHLGSPPPTMAMPPVPASPRPSGVPLATPSPSASTLAAATNEGAPSPRGSLASGAHSAPAEAPPRRWKLFIALACLLLLSMVGGALLASEYVK